MWVGAQPVSHESHSVGTAQLGVMLQSVGAQQLGAAGRSCKEPWAHSNLGQPVRSTSGRRRRRLTGSRSVPQAQHVGSALHPHGAAQLGAAGMHSHGAAQLGWQSEPCEHRPAKAGAAVNAAETMRAAVNFQRRIMLGFSHIGNGSRPDHIRLRGASWGHRPALEIGYEAPESGSDSANSIAHEETSGGHTSGATLREMP